MMSTPSPRRRVLAVIRACTLITVVAALSAVGIPERVTAQAGACGVQTLRGSYIFSATGYNIVSGVPQPKAIVEAIDFNGDGTLVVPAATVSINGTISRSAGGIGIYTLDADCRGTVSFTPGPAFDIFIDRAGREGWMIQTNPNTVFQGTLARVVVP